MKLEAKPNDCSPSSPAVENDSPVTWWQSVETRALVNTRINLTLWFTVTCSKLFSSWYNIITLRAGPPNSKVLELLLGCYSNNGLLMWIDKHHDPAFNDFTNEPGKTQKTFNIILAG